jgi:DNA-directed RNA polymerase specialized sigma24 family protein
MTVLATRTIQKKKSLTIPQRVIKSDKTAVKDDIDSYENFIWALARKFTASTEEAEAAEQEIFLDIWRYSEHTGINQSAEEKLIALIALRRLIKHLQ